VLSESAARWLLVLHTGLGVAAVGAATHLVLWLRKARRGAGAVRSVRRFAVITFVLQVLAFVAGNAMYPTYRVQVRAAYLENAAALASDYTARDEELAKLAAREGTPAPRGEATAAMVKRAVKAARWFDVKEHWIALGVITCAGLLLVLMLWDPRRDGRAIEPVVMALAYLVAATLWLGAVIGVLTASWRAV
jgi:hypothetical protein